MKNIWILNLVLLISAIFVVTIWFIREGDYLVLEPFGEVDRDTVCQNIYGTRGLIEEYKTPYILEDVLSKEECMWIIKEAEAHAKQNGGWEKKRHENYPTVDLDTKNIVSLRSYITRTVYERIIPQIEKLYQLPSGMLGINETFVAKYSIGGQTALEAHEDGSEFSFVAVLNDDFIGGGTYFVESKVHMDAKPGSVIVFNGQNRHMGKEITKGTRYILTGFLNLGVEDACNQHDS